jgi:hypothetical protein
MATVESGIESNLAALKQLSEGLLLRAAQDNVYGNLLEIHHPAAPLIDPLFPHKGVGSFGLSISLSQDGQREAGQRVRCESTQLPFQDRIFNTVVLHHVIGSGDEEELSESVRVLARNGALILLGLNRLGWRYRAQDEIRRLPGMAPFRIRARLEALGMTVQGFAGAGLGGLQRPACMATGLSGLAAPLADLLLLQARHRSSPEVTPLRFRKQRTAVVQSAPMRG